MLLTRSLSETTRTAQPASSSNTETRAKSEYTLMVVSESASLATMTDTPCAWFTATEPVMRWLPAGNSVGGGENENWKDTPDKPHSAGASGSCHVHGRTSATPVSPSALLMRFNPCWCCRCCRCRFRCCYCLLLMLALPPLPPNSQTLGAPTLKARL